MEILSITYGKLMWKFKKILGNFEEIREQFGENLNMFEFLKEF